MAEGDTWESFLATVEYHAKLFKGAFEDPIHTGFVSLNVVESFIILNGCDKRRFIRPIEDLMAKHSSGKFEDVQGVIEVLCLYNRNNRFLFESSLSSGLSLVSGSQADCELCLKYGRTTNAKSHTPANCFINPQSALYNKTRADQAHAQFAARGGGRGDGGRGGRGGGRSGGRGAGNQGRGAPATPTNKLLTLCAEYEDAGSDTDKQYNVMIGMKAVLGKGLKAKKALAIKAAAADEDD